MPHLTYDLKSYRNYLRFSYSKHLLVEGRDDKRAFLLLLEDHPPSSQNIQVDTAEHLVDFGACIGNRQKVEEVCHSAIDSTWGTKLTGFVDRDFRGFAMRPHLEDRLQRHRISNRLVWSRGHSIENYLFDVDILQKPLRMFSPTDTYTDALELFVALFHNTVRLACAVSLTGNELQKLGLVKSSISRRVLRINDDCTLILDSSIWKDELVRRHHLCPERAQELTDTFLLWQHKVEQCDFDTVRWMCHGHIGLAFIWSAYSRCIAESCKLKGWSEQEAEKEAQRVLKTEERIRFRACAETWVDMAANRQSCFPTEVLTLLDVGHHLASPDRTHMLHCPNTASL